jgi:hypothetical protein
MHAPRGAASAAEVSTGPTPLSVHAFRLVSGFMLGRQPKDTVSPLVGVSIEYSTGPWVWIPGLPRIVLLRHTRRDHPNPLYPAGGFELDEVMTHSKADQACFLLGRMILASL